LTVTEPNADLAALPWRHGGHFPRHVYAQVGPEPSSVVDPYVGTLETPELADEVIGAHNDGHVYILHDADPHGFASFTIPRVFGDAEVAKETASEHVGNRAEWVPFGPSLSSLILKCDGKFTSVTIRRVRVER
jgi:hypothetical protein